MTAFQTSESGKRNSKVIFLLTGWKTRLWTYWLIEKILSQNGFYCITYAYDDGVLSPNVKKTVASLIEIRNDILVKITKLKRNGHQDFSVFGTSLGTLIALMVANRSPQISKIILNTTGSELADAIWSWDVFQPDFKKKIIGQGHILQQLRKEFVPVSPIHNIDALQGKKILVYLSRNDEVIPYHLGEKLIQAFQQLNYDYQLVVNNHSGHFLSGAKNLTNYKKYITFLNGKG